jgi:hypothetical protein
MTGPWCSVRTLKIIKNNTGELKALIAKDIITSDIRSKYQPCNFHFIKNKVQSLFSMIRKNECEHRLHLLFELEYVIPCLRLCRENAM